MWRWNHEWFCNNSFEFFSCEIIHAKRGVWEFKVYLIINFISLLIIGSKYFHGYNHHNRISILSWIHMLTKLAGKVSSNNLKCYVLLDGEVQLGEVKSWNHIQFMKRLGMPIQWLWENTDFMIWFLHKFSCNQLQSVVHNW